PSIPRRPRSVRPARTARCYSRRDGERAASLAGAPSPGPAYVRSVRRTGPAVPVLAPGRRTRPRRNRPATGGGRARPLPSQTTATMPRPLGALRALIAALLVLAGVAGRPGPVAAQAATAVTPGVAVVRVVDGDTVDMQLPEGRRERVRLIGMD